MSEKELREQIAHEQVCGRIVDELNRHGIVYGVSLDGEMCFANPENKAKGEKIIKRCYRERMMKGGAGNG